MGHGELILAVVAPLGQPVHGRSAGVADPQHPGHLVKTLSRRIVPGTAQDFHFGIGFYIHNGGGTSGDAKAHKGGLQIRVGNVVGSDVTPDMVDRNEGEPQGHGSPLGKIHPYQHRPDEAGGIGDGNGIQVRAGKAGIGQGLVGQAIYRLDVLPGGDLRDHASVNGVHLDLRGHTAGQHRPSVLDYGGSSIVAGGFDSKNIHGKSTCFQ